MNRATERWVRREPATGAERRVYGGHAPVTRLREDGEVERYEVPVDLVVWRLERVEPPAEPRMSCRTGPEVQLTDGEGRPLPWT